MINFNNVVFYYGSSKEASDKKIKNVSFDIGSGECILLCGRSGAGKSTILKLITGLAPQFYQGILEGTVLILNKAPDLMTAKEKAEIFGVVFQDPRSQFFMQKVQDEIAFSAENIGIASDLILNNIQNISKLLQLESLLDKNVDELSSGQKQRIAIAAAFILKPKILILDEPISNLDKNGINTVVGMLKDIKKQGTTVIISEHRIFEFAALADKIFHISDGVLENVWLPEEFIKMDCFKLSEYGFRHPDMVINRCKRNKRLNRDLLLKNLCYHYRNTHFGIENINIEISKGDIVALVGGNGAGKTILCKLLCGLISEKSGSIIWDGKVLKASQRRKISYFVMQDADYQLYADSVGNELVIGKKITEELKEKAQAALDLFKLKKYTNTHPASLSGGEKQRVTIASAYCSNTAIYIFDEPTSGMDGEGLLSFAEWVNLLANSGKIIIIITHDELLQTLVCDYKICLKNGKISKAIK